MAQTFTRDGRPVNTFSWSYSKLDGFEQCPKKYYHQNIARDVQDTKGEAAMWGDTLHKLAAQRLGEKQPLEQSVAETLEPWCERIERIQKAGGHLYVEQKLALAEDFQPTSWFGKFPRAAWCRYIGDVVAISPSGREAVGWDWKTGNVKEDSVQLALGAAFIFAHHPNVQKVRTEFIWLKHDCSTREDFVRDDLPQIWATLLPRVNQVKHAHETNEFPAKKNGLCGKWCPVKSCQYNGGYNDVRS